MNVTDVQRMLAHAGYYKGGLDGDIGPKTMKAVEVIERTQASQYPRGYKRWSKTRRVFASGQAMLNAWGFEAGSIDGYVGHNTKEAHAGWAYKQARGRRESVKRTPVPTSSGVGTRHIPRQKDCPAFYGRTRAEVERQLVTITLPFYFRIDWNTRQKTNKLRVHKKCAAAFLAAWTEVFQHYGIGRMRELGIDRNAGTFNWRRMRGGSRLSMHSYGCAQDVYAQPNGLRMRCPQALFCSPAYKPFLDIMQKHGLLPAIRLWGADAMHFQMARL
ncbi:MAG: peptidoglycan-binding protein [Pseudomonadota bacterium]